jgi:murein DD-endopeptidase MepM/ murein hydrolase activator NlpD
MAYSQAGADELVFLDITASHEGRKTFAEMVTRVAENINIPFTVGGGINSIEDVERLLYAGADKVSVNSAALRRPELIDEIARRAQQGSGEASGDNFTNDQGFKVSSKGYICPLQYPGTYISAGYPRYPSGGAHSGVDYCVSGGTMGKNVRAIAGGTVILVKSKTTSYGKHIMIDHGNGVTSLYAHGSALLVSEGQHVNQGDIIMLAGETGNATGPHVHLEIRINGTRVNPSNYVDLP